MPTSATGWKSWAAKFPASVATWKRNTAATATPCSGSCWPIACSAKPCDYGRRLLDQGLITELPALERVKGRIDKLIGQIRGAMQGYSGMFDLVKVDEKVLDRVYEHDVKLLDQVEALAVAVEALPQATGRPAEVLPGVLSSLDSLDQAWHQRTDILKGIE